MYTAPENGQVIGALQGMEIGDSTTTMVDQEKETRVESDVQGDDLLGEDLEAMEEGKILLQNEWFILLLQRVKKLKLHHQARNEQELESHTGFKAKR